MAASMAYGINIITMPHATYIQQLCKMINRMGGKISGVGSNMLTIEGVDYLEEQNTACSRI
jgi:UDP-N-acetylglucosamine 1-carboxyvinyltransferase